jgi:hypothetical protein
LNKKLKKIWLMNGVIAVTLLAAIVVVRQFTSAANAAGGGWETDGILVNTTDSANERLVLVDTESKRIMVYKTDAGQFRLTSARSYFYDTDMIDTSKTEEIERKNGITFIQAFEFWQQELQKK